MRRSAYILFCAYFFALVFATLSGASANSPVGKKQINHARHVIKFFEHHPKQAATPSGQKALIGAAHVLDSAVRSLQAVKAAREKASAEFPPHHALWVCIQRFEGPWNSRAGDTNIYEHYGGLQMTWNWMKLIHGNAGNLSQAEQEWAAEKAWAANGYSYSFLYGQWYAYDSADGCGVTG